MTIAPTTVLLVRHGHAAPVDRWLAGRRAGIPLSDRGRDEVAALAEALRASPLRPAVVYSSPLERAWDTAWALAAATTLTVVTRQAFTEIEYGAWTGKTLCELSGDPEWHAYNADRERRRPPGGESLGEAQGRMVAELERLKTLHPAEVVLVVSHADPIRAAIAYYTGTRLNDAQRFTLATASLTRIALGPRRSTVLRINVPPAGLAEPRLPTSPDAPPLR
jgi:ribonuclease H / adenosylcobalamin/alpha-ribazole phosphatase